MSKNTRFSIVPWALQDQTWANPNVIAVWASLMRHAHFKPEASGEFLVFNGARPSLDVLQQEAHLSRHPVLGALRILKHHKVVDWDPGGSNGRANNYLITIPHGWLDGSDIESAVQNVHSSSAESAPQQCTISTPAVQNVHSNRVLPDPITDPIPEASTSSKGRRKSKKSKSAHSSTEVVAKKQTVTWMTPFWDAWVKQYGGKPAAGPLAKYLLPLIKEHGEARVLAAWRAYLANTPAEYANPARFSSTFGKWAGKAMPICSSSNPKPLKVIRF